MFRVNVPERLAHTKADNGQTEMAHQEEHQPNGAEIHATTATY